MNEHRRFRLAETRAPHLPLRRRLMSAALAAGALALGAGLGFVPAPVLAEESPDALIERVGNELIRLIADDEAIKRGDMGAINRLVDEKVMPYVNFERMTALSAGRWWREATPEQRKQLMTEFRNMLLRTYSGALEQVGNQTLRMKPLRAQPGATDVIVRSEIVQPGREPIQLDYRMHKVGDGWKIYDLNILGIWIVETYRSQFNQEAQRTGVDGLIRSLADKNREFGPGKGSQGT